MVQEAASASVIAGQVKAILADQGTGQGNLLPVLHAIQDAVGYISSETVGDIAAAFNLSRAEVHGVVTFYHHFRTKPPARHVIQICRAEACQSMGAEHLVEHAQKALGCAMHAHSADGKFSLEPVYCLGQCATSPAVMIDDALHAKVTPARFDRLIGKLAVQEAAVAEVAP
jgi:formate dehydrogenase subunit gamma